jgi:tRNA nucleotidyltransferase (CCA-adding enzyme)
MGPRAPGHARWEHFAHAADIGVRGVGATLQEAFEQAALALTGVLVDPRLVRRLTTIDISCDAPDDELLLVDWLNALVYEMATRRMLFAGFEVHVENSRLTARVHGEPVDRCRHQPAVEVKGATYTCLQVARTETGGWLAQCVVDV